MSQELLCHSEMDPFIFASVATVYTKHTHTIYEIQVHNIIDAANTESRFSLDVNFEDRSLSANNTLSGYRIFQ